MPLAESTRTSSSHSFSLTQKLVYKYSVISILIECKVHVRLSVDINSIGAQEADGGEEEKQRAAVVVVQAIDEVVVNSLRPQRHLLLHAAHDTRVHRAALLRANG